MVTGFYYHAEFYKLGWIGLLILGSIITFITVKVILYLSYSWPQMKEFEGALIFKSEEVNPIKHGKIKQIIKPGRECNIRPDAVYQAKLNIMSERYFSELLITNIFSKKLKELSEKDILLTGAGSRKEFKKRWVVKYGRWVPNMDVTMIRFESIEKD